MDINWIDYQKLLEKLLEHVVAQYPGAVAAIGSVAGFMVLGIILMLLAIIYVCLQIPRETTKEIYKEIKEK